MDRRIEVCLLFLALIGLGVDAVCPIAPDPCTEYIEVDDPTRSTGYTAGSSYESDYALAEDWYRFVSGAGGDMPTQAPATGQCGAFAPVWLDDNLPSVADGITNLDACASFLGVTCIRSYEVTVKNCGLFRVYCLSATSDSYDRYCLGSESECPHGSASATGFTPCTDTAHLDLPSDPSISYESAYTEIPVPGGITFCSPYYNFECSATHGDPNVFFDVTWYANDVLFQQHIEDNAIAFADMPHMITSTDLLDGGYKIGTNLTCRVAVREDNTAVALVGSSGECHFYVGIEVPDESLFIEIEEGGPAAYYNASFTIPYRCFQNCDNVGVVPCRFEIDIVSPDQNPGTCSSDVVVELQSDLPGTPSCTTDSDEFGFSMKVHANTDHTYNPDRQMVLQLSTRPNDFLPFWAEYSLPRSHVVIADTEMQTLAGRYCGVSDDPHFHTFDRQSFEIQLTGAFIMYKHKTLPILVEVYFSILHTWSWRGFSSSWTNNCGGAVRSGGEVFVYDACRHGEPVYVTNYECNEGLQNMKVVRRSSSSYEITLSTGTRVILGTSSQYVYPSVFDFGETEGLCGNFNGDNTDEDDRIIRNSNPSEADAPTISRGRHYHAFSNSWRVADEDSLYFGVVRDELDFDDIVFCTCVNTTDDETDPGASCSTAPNVKFCVAGDHNEASGDQHRCALSRRRKRRDAAGSDLDEGDRQMFSYDPNFVAEPIGWTNGWTQESATEYCEEYFTENSVSACGDVPNLNIQQSVDECVDDIYISGTTNYSDVHVNDYIESCQSEASMYVFESSGNSTLNVTADVANIVLSQTCSGGCSHHGTCVNGVCACDDGFTSTDCSAELNHVPQLFDLPNNGTCNLANLPCEIMSVYADQYIEDSVFCRLRIIDINTNAASDHAVIQGEYMHVQRALCVIDPVEIMDNIEAITGPYHVEIAVANSIDGEYSASTQALVYNSICWDCDQESNCVNVANQCADVDTCYTDGESHYDRSCHVCDGSDGTWYLQDNTCLIGNSCYEDGDENPNNPEQICDVSSNATSWTDLDEEPEDEDSNNNNDDDNNEDADDDDDDDDDTGDVDDDNDNGDEDDDDDDGDDDDEDAEQGDQEKLQNKSNINDEAEMMIIIIVCCVAAVVVVIVAVVVYFKCFRGKGNKPTLLEKKKANRNPLVEIIDQVHPPTDHKGYSKQALAERYSAGKLGTANIVTTAPMMTNPNPPMYAPIAHAPMTNRSARSTSNVSTAKTARGKPMQWTSRPQSAASNRSGSALGSRTSLNAAPFSRHGVDPASRAQTPGGIDLGFGL